MNIFSCRFETWTSVKKVVKACMFLNHLFSNFSNRDLHTFQRKGCFLLCSVVIFIAYIHKRRVLWDNFFLQNIGINRKGKTFGILQEFNPGLLSSGLNVLPQCFKPLYFLIYWKLKNLACRTWAEIHQPLLVEFFIGEFHPRVLRLVNLTPGFYNSKQISLTKQNNLEIIIAW